jgi:DinB superfamily
MVDYIKQMLVSQFEASLCMTKQCVEACSPEHWEGKIANDTFRYVAYHTLFFADLYLSKSEDAFVRHEFILRGGDESGEAQAAGLSRDDTLAYVAFSRKKLIETIAAETAESLAGPSGFSWRKFSRAEMHVYNIRHIQHHAGQLSAYLRRVNPALSDPKTLPWVGAGWK